VLNDYLANSTYENIIAESLEKKAKIDVVGFQAHMHSSYWGAQKTWDMCERFSRFGKPLHITEVTIVSGPKLIYEWPTTPSGEERQAHQAEEFYRVLFSHPSVEAITWWDFSDNGAWQGASAGLLRKDMSPKSAYLALRRLIKEEWWSKATVSVGRDGTIGFRGFYGDYEIAVEGGGGTMQGQFSLAKGIESRTVEMGGR
jgi:GH35 family endo-1,4-beta-xylanase